MSKINTNIDLTPCTQGFAKGETNAVIINTLGWPRTEVVSLSANQAKNSLKISDSLKQFDSDGNVLGLLMICYLS